ncbi:MAG TPA: ParA family partition ATPase [Pyrinomonadaceae bacterium]|nr:ParA family partition ATPase [Pyrinomonadaceae bacterium]
MTAKIIAVCNQKGGTGKTTVSMQLAGSLARRGGRVMVVDADPQGTATRWAATAPDDRAFPAVVMGLSAAGGKLHREVRKLVGDYDYIVIDCPPAADSPVPQSALLVADLALVPIIPSPPDLWAAVGIRHIIENAGDINEGLRSRLVVNMCQSTAIAKDALEILPEFGAEVCEAKLRLRTAYRQSAIDGQSVHAGGARASAAVEEVEALTSEVLTILNPAAGRRRGASGPRG